MSQGSLKAKNSVAVNVRGSLQLCGLHLESLHDPRWHLGRAEGKGMCKGRHTYSKDAA